MSIQYMHSLAYYVSLQRFSYIWKEWAYLSVNGITVNLLHTSLKKTGDKGE